MSVFSFVVTEHDPERPWLVRAQDWHTVPLEDGVSFFEWAAEHWPAPRWTVELDPWQLAGTLGREWVLGGTFRGVEMEEDLWCPRCGERVLDPDESTAGEQHRATCPQCHVELVRRPDLADDTWQVDDPTPPPDEELGGGE